MCCAIPVSDVAFVNTSARSAARPRSVSMCRRWEFHSEMKKNLVPPRRGCLGLLFFGGVTLFLLIVAAAILSPALAAQGSDVLRAMIGDLAVARLESFVFQ